MKNMKSGRFSVGDRVKIISDLFCKNKIATILTITNSQYSDYPIRVQIDSYHEDDESLPVWPEELELVNPS